MSSKLYFRYLTLKTTHISELPRQAEVLQLPVSGGGGWWRRGRGRGPARPRPRPQRRLAQGEQERGQAGEQVERPLGDLQQGEDTTS